VKLTLLIALFLSGLAQDALAQEQSAVPAALTEDQLEALAPADSAVEYGSEVPPVQWTQWQLTGTLLDNSETLREVLLGTMTEHRALTQAARAAIAEVIAKLGYQLVQLTTETVPGGGIKAVLEVAPRPLIRSVLVTSDVQWTWKFWKRTFWQVLTTVSLNDEVQRRMRLRTGSYLPWAADARAAEVVLEKKRLTEFLYEQGFFEGTVNLDIDFESAGAARLRVTIKLGPEYHLGRITIIEPGGLAMSEREIKRQFSHDDTCFIWELCVGTARFTRLQHQEDVKRLTERYQQLGFPAVRIQAPTSYNRLSKSVDVTLLIDERRRIDVAFEGHDPDRVSTEQLSRLLTFAQAGSADDVEANESTAALTTYLQGRGYFEARVTWRRERLRSQDQIIFRINLGEPRRVRRVEFLGSQVFTQAELTELIATRPYGTIVRLFGNTPPVTSQQLNDDADRIVRAYRQRGYRDAKVEVLAAPTLEALSSVALSAALISSASASGTLYVRFLIDEGKPTYVRRIEIKLPDGTSSVVPGLADLCEQVLSRLARALAMPTASSRRDTQSCIADVNLIYREDSVDLSADAVRDLLQAQARPNALVEMEKREEGAEYIDLTYRLSQLDTRRVGKVILRGNFRTRRGVILGELGFVEGLPLTTDVTAEGQRKLRATGLFDRVSVNYVDVDGVSHAVVQVEERYDSRVQIDLEAGASEYIGIFGKIRGLLPNWLGVGLTLDASATVGNKAQLYDSRLRIPRFLIRRVSPVAFDGEFSVFWQQQDTNRFGRLLTKGATVAASRTWQRNNAPSRPARALSTSLRYDFRLRDRQVESIRPAGTDSDQSQIPITTVAGAVALTFDWEQRVTRGGELSPLSPETGFRLQSSISLASPVLLGQDTFLKIGGSAQVYWPLGSKLLVRTDLRYDHGFPLGSDVVLPEVERFFAGGDSTVRGYDEDRLATEIIEESVPPFSGTRQIRVVAAGGNIRAISSIDAQLSIAGPLATAIFLDAGVVTNDWRATELNAIRPGTGMAVRAVLPFGAVSLEYAVPLRAKLGDDPRGRIHFGFAMRFD
jgi:outer membrane protein insertion porin family